VAHPTVITAFTEAESGRSMAKTSPASKAHRALRQAALGDPEAVEDFPWGAPVMKVRGKIFLFLQLDDEALHVTAKLPQSSGIALMLPNVEPAATTWGARAGSAHVRPQRRAAAEELLAGSRRATAAWRRAGSSPASTPRRPAPAGRARARPKAPREGKL
jgi:hypothetical protein